MPDRVIRIDKEKKKRKKKKNRRRKKKDNRKKRTGGIEGRKRKRREGRLSERRLLFSHHCKRYRQSRPIFFNVTSSYEIRYFFFSLNYRDLVYLTGSFPVSGSER